MHPTNADFGRRLFSRRTTATRGYMWICAGGCIVTLALLALSDAGLALAQHPLVSDALPYARWGIAALSGCCCLIGLRHVLKYAGRAKHFYELGACVENGRRRQWLLYADVETVTYRTRAGGEWPRSRWLEFSGPRGEPRVTLFTDMAAGEPGDDHRSSVAEVQDVLRRVAGAVTSRMVEQLNRREAVRWAGWLWLTAAGVRLGEKSGDTLIPWADVDGVKDGSQNGQIEIYAFGNPKPVAAAPADAPNALPGFEAFMLFLDQAQKSKAA